MLWQMAIAAAVVGSCLVYALWTLMPVALRRTVAATLLRVTWLADSGSLQRIAQAPASGCGCTGCDAVKPVAPLRAATTIRWHPRRTR